MGVNTELASKVWNRYRYAREQGHVQFVKKATICDAFFRGDQWDPLDLQRLKAGRRPALTINKIISTIGNVMGEQIYNRSEISFRPKSGANAKTAEVLTKVFKQISDNNQLDWRRSDMFADGIITSRGFLDVRLDFNDNMQGEVRIENVNPKNVLIDCDAEEHDPDSWNEVITTKWLTIDDIAVLYGQENANLLKDRDGSASLYGQDAFEFERDRFGEKTALSATQSAEDAEAKPVIRNLRVIERQHRVLDRQKHFINTTTGDTRQVPEGWDAKRIELVRQQFGYGVITKLVKRIKWTVICDDVVLHDEWSPYKHFTVVPYFPYFRRGTTIGLVENLVGPQELLNKVSSQELHVVNSSANGGYKVKTGALTTMSIEELEARGAETGLVIEMNGSLDEVEKLTPNATPTGLDRISYKAEEHIKTISGISDSQQGMDREDVAAKAIQTKRQAASTNMAKPMDSLVRSDFMLARNILDLVQAFYTEERLMTIAHERDGGGIEEVVINQVNPMSEEEHMASGEPGPYQAIINDLTLGEFDVTISSVPQRETLEDSQFDQAVSMKKDLGINIPDEFIIKASRMLNKNDVIKSLNDAKNSEAAQAAAALAQRGQEAEISKTEAEAAHKVADTQLKQAKAQSEGVKAQKDAATPIEGPEQESASEVMKIQAEMQLVRDQFEFDMAMAQKEFELKEKEMQAKQALAQQAQAQKAATDRIATNKPQPQKTGA